MIKKYIVNKKISDKEISDKEGEYFKESDIDIIIDENADVFTEEGKLLLKLRKKVLSNDSCKNAVNSFKDFSKKKHENRGASAGILDRNKMPKYIGEFVNPGKFRTKFVSSTSGIESKQATSNLSPSNIAGFYDRPDRNLKGKGAPCRLTAFNRDYPELWKKSIPFIKECDMMFKKLVPDRYNNQKKRADQTKDFTIDNTSFSTITINYSWQTALHRDAGDYVEGFGNLIVLEDHHNQNTYTGGYTCFPQFGVGVNVRQGDFLAMDVHEWHCNTQLIPIHDKIFGKWNKTEIENLWYLNRLSVVCYLRDNMLRCKDLNKNKLQLLNSRNNEKDIIFKLIKDYPKPQNSQQYSEVNNLLWDNVENKYKKDEIENSILKYVCFKYYYLDDYGNEDEKSELLKEINYIKTHFDLSTENNKILEFIISNK